MSYLTKTARQRAEHPSDRHKETAKQKAARIKAGGPTKQQKHKATGRLGTRRIAKRHEQAMPEGTSIYDVDKQKTKKIPTVTAPKGSTKRRPTSKEKAADKRKYPSVLKKAGGKVKGYKHGGFIGRQLDGSKIVSGGYD